MLYFDEYGNRDNPTILLLHGAGALDTFCQQYKFLSQYHLVVPHLAGAGKAADKIYEPEKITQELYGLIANLHKKKVGIIGHSLGGQLAVMLVSKRPKLFSFAIFLSAWVNPKPKTIRKYCMVAGVAIKMLHCKRLVMFQGKYWNYNAEQASYMAEYAKLITPQVYRSFFYNTLELSKLPEYQSVDIPMLGICGDKEIKDVRISLTLLAENPFCKTMMLQRANHDFPMRNANKLNPLIGKFILECL